VCSSDEGLVDEADEALASSSPSGGNITVSAYTPYPFLQSKIVNLEP
jgi:hypothetical protein